MRSSEFGSRFKQILFLTSCIELAAIASAHANPGMLNRPADVRAITAIEAHLSTNFDPDEVVEYYASPAIVEEIYAPDLFVGKRQVYADLGGAAAVTKSVQSKISELNIITDGAFACAAVERESIYTLNNGATAQANIRQLDALKKINGRWEIIQQQISIPTNLATETANLGGTLPSRGAMNWPDGLLSEPAVSASQAKREIRAWAVALATATRIGQVMKSYGPDDNVLVYDEFTPGELRGLSEIENHYKPFYAPAMNAVASIDVEFPLFSVDSDGSLGAQISIQTLVTHLKNGTVTHYSFRQSDCLHRVDGKWYSVLEMVSFPIDPKTQKPIYHRASN